MIAAAVGGLPVVAQTRCGKEPFASEVAARGQSRYYTHRLRGPHPLRPYRCWHCPAGTWHLTSSGRSATLVGSLTGRRPT
jgi:hypothetical protein